jgi:hypothetical protein
MSSRFLMTKQAIPELSFAPVQAQAQFSLEFLSLSLIQN